MLTMRADEAGGLGRSGIACQHERGSWRWRMWRRWLTSAAVAAALSGPLLGAVDITPAEPTLTERLTEFASADSMARAALMPTLVPVKANDEFDRCKVPEFLIKVVKDGDEHPLVRNAAIDAMVTALQRFGTANREAYIAVWLEVLNEKMPGLVQEHILTVCPAAIDAAGPGPNALFIHAVAAIATDARATGDNELRRRVQALAALGGIGHRDSLDLILGLMADANPTLATGAAEALGRYLAVTRGMDFSLTAAQLPPLTLLLKKKETPYPTRAVILRALGYNARTYRLKTPSATTAQGVADAMSEIRRLLALPKDEPLPPVPLVGAYSEALGLIGNAEAVGLLGQMFDWWYLQNPEGVSVRRNAVQVLDQIIRFNPGDGKVGNPVAEACGVVLAARVVEPAEDAELRRAAAFYLSDLRFACNRRDLYFDALFRCAFADPAQPPLPLDATLAATSRSSMEVLAGRSFPAEWGRDDMIQWWNAVGRAALAPKPPLAAIIKTVKGAETRSGGGANE